MWCAVLWHMLHIQQDHAVQLFKSMLTVSSTRIHLWWTTCYQTGWVNFKLFSEHVWLGRYPILEKLHRDLFIPVIELIPTAYENRMTPFVQRPQTSKLLLDLIWLFILQITLTIVQVWQIYLHKTDCTFDNYGTNWLLCTSTVCCRENW